MQRITRLRLTSSRAPLARAGGPDSLAVAPSIITISNQIKRDRDEDHTMRLKRYSLFERRGKVYRRICCLALPMEHALRVYRGALPAAEGFEKTLRKGKAQRDDNQHSCTGSRIST